MYTSLTFLLFFVIVLAIYHSLAWRCGQDFS